MASVASPPPPRQGVFCGALCPVRAGVLIHEPSSFALPSISTLHTLRPPPPLVFAFGVPQSVSFAFAAATPLEAGAADALGREGSWCVCARDIGARLT